MMIKAIKQNDSYFTPYVGCVSRYLNEVSKSKILDETEIRSLLKLSKIGDRVATDKVVKSYQRFVFSVAKEYSNRNSNLLSDLINEGNIGLLKSIQSYDSKFGVKFISYSVHLIRKEMLAYLTFTEPTIKISNRPKNSNKIKDITNEFMLLNGRLPSTDEIIDTLFEKHNIEVINESDVYNVDFKSMNDESIFGSNTDESSDLEFKFEGMMSSSNDYEDQIQCDYNKTVINNAIGVLSDKERDVIMSLYGIGQFKETNCEDIAYRLNMTSEGIRMVGKRALNKMKEAIVEREYSI